jgi:hypothetical protein
MKFHPAHTDDIIAEYIGAPTETPSNVLVLPRRPRPLSTGEYEAEILSLKTENAVLGQECDRLERVAKDINDAAETKTTKLETAVVSWQIATLAFALMFGSSIWAHFVRVMGVK